MSGSKVFTSTAGKAGQTAVSQPGLLSRMGNAIGNGAKAVGNFLASPFSSSKNGAVPFPASYHQTQTHTAPTKETRDSHGITIDGSSDVKSRNEPHDVKAQPAARGNGKGKD